MDKNTSLPALMTVLEFREYLHISTEYAYKLIKQRSFPSFKIGKKYFVNKDKLSDWIEKQCQMIK